MSKSIHLLLGVFLITLPSCATLEKSTLLGAGIGAAGGTGIGLAVEQSAGSALIGTAIGAIIGGAFGYLGHKEQEKKDLLAKVGARRKPTAQEYPKIKEPEANCITIEERIEGNRYIGPHILCTIEKPAFFTR